MIVTNMQLRFAFNINTPFKEVTKEGYAFLALNSSQIDRVLNAFVVLDNENKIVRSLALVLDAPFENDEQYKQIFNNNVINMLKLGYKILSSYDLTFANGRGAQKIIYQTQNEKVAFLMTKIHGVAVGASSIITAEGDEFDKEITNIFSSITEF